MEIIGKLAKKLQEQNGESQRGHWVKMDFVIETSDQFPKQVCFSLWGEEKVSIVRNMQIGAEIKVYFSPESREFNERWYTELKCFRIDVLGAINQTQQVAPPQQSNVTPTTNVQGAMFDNNNEPEGNDDLPF